MSRPLVLLAALVFAGLALLPLVPMLARVDGADLASLLDARTRSLLGRTLALGLSTAAGAVLLGAPFGFLVARAELPGANLLRALGIVPLLLPPLLLAMVWTTLLPELRGAPATAAILSLSTAPLVGLFTARACERIDARQEEAARLAGGLGAVLLLELPLVLPAVLCGACLAFVFAVNDFAVPDYVSSIGPKFNVYADEIKLSWDQRGEPGRAVAAALPLVACTLATLGPALALRRRGSLATLGGDFVQPARLALGRARLPAFLLVLAVVSAGALVPLGRLLWEAAGMPRHVQEAGGLLAAAAAGWDTLGSELSRALELARDDLARSLRYSTAAALVCVPVGLVVGHALERARARRLARVLELLVLLPLAVPAILFGIGIVTLWNHDATAAFYDSGAMAVTLFAGRHAAFAVLVLSGATAALDPRLEEAGALAGAGPGLRLLTLVAPCLRGALVASFVLVAVFSLRDLDAALLVPAANRTAVLRVFNGVHFGRDAYVAALSLLLVFAILLPGLLWTLVTRRRLEILP